MGVHACVRECTCVCVCECTCIYMCMCVCACMCVCVCTCVCECTCMYLIVDRPVLKGPAVETREQYYYVNESHSMIKHFGNVWCSACATRGVVNPPELLTLPFIIYKASITLKRPQAENFPPQRRFDFSRERKDYRIHIYKFTSSSYIYIYVVVLNYFFLVL